MISEIKISQIITVLFCFVLFLRYVGGEFHIVSIGVPIVLIVALSIIYSFKSKKYFEIYTYASLLFLFVLYLFFGTLYSRAPEYGQAKTTTLFMFIFVSAVSAKYILLNFKLFLKANLFFFLLFYAAYFAFYGSFGNILRSLNVGSRGEMGGEVFGAIDASRYIGFNLICLYFLFIKKIFNFRFRKVVFIFLFTISLFMMFLFGSKGPIVSLIIAPTLFFVFHKKNSFKKNLFVVSTILVFGFILINPEAVVKLIPQPYQAYFEYRFFNYDNYTSDRPALMKLALADIDDGSVLFGKGTGNYGFLYAHKDIQIYPHNIFVEILYENGIFGLILFLILLFRNLYTKSPISKYFENRNLLIVLIYYFLINAQFTGDFSINFGLFVFLTFAYYQVKNEKKIFYILKILKKPFREKSRLAI